MSLKNETTIIGEPGKQELYIIREFDAPRELVFKAFTDPDLLVQWIGPKGYVMKIDYYDPRSGGSYRYVHTDPNGNAWGFHGTIHEIKAHERAIQTFEFEGMPEAGHVALETARFEVLADNRTKVTVQSVFQSVADRDGMLQSGMEKGVNQGHDQLDRLLAKQLVQ